MSRVCPGALSPGPGWVPSGESPAAPGLEILTGREAWVVPPPHPTSALSALPPPPPPILPSWPPNFDPVLLPEGWPGCAECGHPMARPGLERQAWLLDLIPWASLPACLPTRLGRREGMLGAGWNGESGRGWSLDLKKKKGEGEVAPGGHEPQTPRAEARGWRLAEAEGREAYDVWRRGDRDRRSRNGGTVGKSPQGVRLGKESGPCPPLLPPPTPVWPTGHLRAGVRERKHAGALRSPSSWGALESTEEHQELGIFREERLNPHSTGKQPTPLASFPLRGLRSPFPAWPPGSVSAGGGEVRRGKRCVGDG